MFDERQARGDKARELASELILAQLIAILWAYEWHVVSALFWDGAYWSARLSHSFLISRIYSGQYESD